MKAKVLLRIAAALILIHFIGHSFGHLSWDAPEDPKMMEAVTAMKTHKAGFMGAVKSFADYYTGYSFMIFGLFGLSILVLWSASGFIDKHSDIARKVLLPFGIAYLYLGVVEYLYFFPFAAAISFFAGVLIMLAITVAKPKAI